MGTTYHEAGTLWMGDSPASSVTNTAGRFHHVTNAYACDQSLFPTAGSVNPVLTGLTLARTRGRGAVTFGKHKGPVYGFSSYYVVIG